MEMPIIISIIVPVPMMYSDISQVSHLTKHHTGQYLIVNARLGRNIHFQLLISLGFEKYPGGENCPSDRIVATVDECKAASAVLGLTGGTNFHQDSSGYPAGCYWKNTYLYFNAVVDPSQTNPESFGVRGGVCFKGKFDIVIRLSLIHI